MSSGFAVDGRVAVLRAPTKNVDYRIEIQRPEPGFSLPRYAHADCTEAEATKLVHCLSLVLPAAVFTAELTPTLRSVFASLSSRERERWTRDLGFDQPPWR
jgi:hypothetical protein